MRASAILALVLLVGCAAAPAPASHAALETTDVEVVLSPRGTLGPPGSDAPPTFVVEIRGPDGARRALPDAALGAVSWNAGAAVLREDHTLVYEHLDGRTIAVATDVLAPPVATADGSRIAFARETTGLVEVVVHDGSRGAVAARGLASAGAFTFSDDGALVAFVGAANGGIAGAWITRSDGRALSPTTTAMCLSSCALRVGDVSVEMPSRILEVTGSAIRFESTAGVVTLPWSAP